MDPIPSVDTPRSDAGGKSLKALWATIGALAVAVVALGGVLLHQRGGDSASPTPPVALAPVRAPDDFKVEPPVAAAPPPPMVSAAPAPAPMPAPVRAPEITPPQVAQAGPGAPQVASPTAPAHKPVCATCGRVESVRTVQKPAPATGVGAVAGGVVGGVVGNQVGHGGGRAAATVIGAVGGGFLGNTIEKRVRTVTVHEVQVRMQDGSLRTVETATAPPIGKAVRLEGNVLRPADGRK